MPTPIAPAESGGPFDSYPVGLNPTGDNWLALRSEPGLGGTRLDKLGPDVRFHVLEQQGDWDNVRLPDGRSGWVAAQYVGCCKTGD